MCVSSAHLSRLQLIGLLCDSLCHHLTPDSTCYMLVQQALVRQISVIKVTWSVLIRVSLQAKVSGCTCWPPQIDLIKEMGAHLFQWYYKGSREQDRREAMCNQKESAVELMNELLICIEIAGLRN